MRHGTGLLRRWFWTAAQGIRALGEDVGRTMRVAGQATSPSRDRRIRVIKGKDVWPYALIAPAVLLVSGVAIYPALMALWVSLWNMNFLRLHEATFAGLGNYHKLFFQDDVFIGAIWRTVRWTGTVIAGQMALALPIALFLNIPFRWRGAVRTVVLIPWVVPSAVTAVIWVYLLDANFGVVNTLLSRLGVISANIAWLSDNTLSFFALVMAMIWSGFPFMAVMLLAALQALPQDVYEAARIDGSGPWQTFRYITLPQLMPTILLVLLLRSMWLSHHVDMIYLVTEGGPGTANMTIAVYSFRLTSIQMNIGYSSAVAIILAGILFMVAVIYIRYIEKSREYLR